MRRSPTSSVGMGTTLELGASTMKKSAAANPAGRRRIAAQAAAAASGTIASSQGHASPTLRRAGQS